jgi:hypothetical protein
MMTLQKNPQTPLVKISWGIFSTIIIAFEYVHPNQACVCTFQDKELVFFTVLTIDVSIIGMAKLR